VGIEVEEIFFKIKPLDKKFLETNIDGFTGILKGIEHEYWERQHFLLDLPAKWVYSLVALDASGKIIGYVIASKKDSHIHIHKFMIEKTVRCLGLGRELLAYLCNKCIDGNIEAISLKVYKDNTRAIKFYEKYGFKHTCVEKDELLKMVATPGKIKAQVKGQVK
jgi:ribosomal protein S18 acetylase RimI-like enzyme